MVGLETERLAKGPTKSTAKASVVVAGAGYLTWGAYPCCKASPLKSHTSVQRHASKSDHTIPYPAIRNHTNEPPSVFVGVGDKHNSQ